MAEQISLAHMGTQVSIVGTVRTEDGWVDDLTVEGLMQGLQLSLMDLPNPTPQQAMATLYIGEEDPPHRVRFDAAAACVTPL